MSHRFSPSSSRSKIGCQQMVAKGRSHKGSSRAARPQLNCLISIAFMLNCFALTSTNAEGTI